jgi:hypothetical protein
MRFLGRVGDWAIRSALVIIPVMLVPFLSGHAFICSASRQSRRPRTPRRVLTTPPNAVSSVTIDISFSQAGTYILTLTRATRLHGQRATTCAWAKLLDFPSRAGCRRRNLLAQLRQREATSFVALGVRSLGSNSRRRYFKVDWTALRRPGLRRGSARLLLDACIFATVHADRKTRIGLCHGRLRRLHCDSDHYACARRHRLLLQSDGKALGRCSCNRGNIASHCRRCFCDLARSEIHQLILCRI